MNTDTLIYLVVLVLAYAGLSLVCEIGRWLIGRGTTTHGHVQGLDVRPT